MNIPLGFEVGTGARVSIPLGHTIVLGQTQLSGKTTTLQAMTERSGVCAIAFITKRGEKSFRAARPIPAYFTETSVMQPYWKFVLSMIENTQETRLGFRERGWVMQLCQDYEISKNETDAKGRRKKISCEWEEPKTLRDVLNNARKAQGFSRGLNAMICMQLVEYLKMAVPEIESAKLSSEINLKPGINVMDISKLSTSVQALVVRSVVEWVYLHRTHTVVIIPEAWKFLPEGRSTPVTFPVEELIRQGAALQNFVWIDLQDLRGIKKLLLRSIQVWLFGVQREKNEVANTLKSMPTPEYKPSASDMMQLGIGQFIVAHGNELRRVYVWPAGMEETHAQAIALGQEDAKSWKRIERALDEEKRTTDEPDQDQREDRGDAPPGSGSDLDAGADSLRAVDAAGIAGSNSTDSANFRGSVGGPNGSASEVNDREDIMWKEKYEALKLDYDALVLRVVGLESLAALAEGVRIEDLSQPSVLTPVDSYTSTAPGGPGAIPPTNTAKQHPASNGSCYFSDDQLQVIYTAIKFRAAKDAGILHLLQQQPELHVELKRHMIKISDDGMDGRIARLISEKFFDAPKDAITVTKEFKRRGWLGNKTPNSQAIGPLDKISALGFLTREASGYQAVKGMKINILEAK